MAKKKIIIDCDAGIDDAQAILLALSAQDVEVIAITCVAGNTPIDKVCVNVLKVLELCNRTDIPVFKGASGPLLGKNSRFYYYVLLTLAGDYLVIYPAVHIWRLMNSSAYTRCPWDCSTSCRSFSPQVD